MQLSKEQQAVIQHQNNHAKVVAVAGAGKTTTLVHFIWQKISEGVSAKRILVLMYNRSTQQDFQTRLGQTKLNQSQNPNLAPSFSSIPNVRTFHSLGLRIYKSLVQQGHLPAFSQVLISEREQEQTVWRLLQEHADKDTKRDILDNKQKWVEPAIGYFDLIKSGLESPERVFKQLALPDECHIFIPAFKQYEQWRQSNARISYADMLYDPCQLFMQRPDLAEQFSGHMHYILVDEYQDMNDIQQFLLDILLQKRGYLIAIGDPDQTIYEFRGSKPELMLSGFDQRYPSHQKYTLSHTFRYGHHLALAVNHLISHNTQRESVLSIPASPDKHTALHIEHTKDYGAKTVSLINTLKENQPLASIAILNRLWASSAPVELALLEANIPYTLERNDSVLTRNELQPFMVLFRIANGELEQWSQKRRLKAIKMLLTTPYPKVKRDILNQLANNLSLKSKDWGRTLRKAIPKTLSQWQQDQLEGRIDILISAEFGNRSAYDLANKFSINTNYLNELKESEFSAQQVEDKTATIKAFLRYIKRKNLLAAQMPEHIERLKQNHANQTEQGVTLTSIHKSKGLEWKTVILPSVEANYYPFLPDKNKLLLGNIESERRLMYVALTRAIDQAWLLTCPTTSYQNQGKNSKEGISSPFIQEAAPKLSGYISEKIVANTQNLSPETLPYNDLTIAKRYLEEVAIDWSIHEIDEKNPKAYLTPAKMQSSSKGFIHNQLGVGRVLSENKKAWTVMLATGEQKTLLKDVAKEYMQWMD